MPDIGELEDTRVRKEHRPAQGDEGSADVRTDGTGCFEGEEGGGCGVHKGVDGGHGGLDGRSGGTVAGEKIDNGWEDMCQARKVLDADRKRNIG